MAVNGYQLHLRGDTSKYAPGALLAYLIAKGVSVGHLEIDGCQWTLRGPGGLEILAKHEGTTVTGSVKLIPTDNRRADQIQALIVEFYSNSSPKPQHPDL